MTGCVVRAAGGDDLLSVLQVLARADEGRVERSNVVTPDESDMWARMMATDDVTVYVAEFDGAVVGTATFLVLPNITYDCRPTGFIEAMVVKAAYRRRGVAMAILKRILDDARQLGCHKIQLLSHKAHAVDGAHDLYRAAGFEPEAEGFRLYLTP
ncbi:MAG: GNAT family N-acetyltransferase [Actinomycetota bacterium]